MEYFKSKIEPKNKANRTNSAEGIYSKSYDYYIPLDVKQEREERGLATTLSHYDRVKVGS